MKIIKLEQGSPEWISWRKTVITATDCPAIRGSSIWVTPYKCWQRKLGLVAEQSSNGSMERGKKLEPIIRERFIEKFCLKMTPEVVESSEYEFLGASLDGLSESGRFILEIKTGGPKLYKMAQEGTIPPYYMDQMQHQLLVTGAEKCFYCVGDEDPTKDIVIEVYPDPNFAKDFIPQARYFWKCIAFNEPPTLQASDYKDMSEDDSWNEITTGYKNICDKIERMEEEKEVFRKRLLALCDDQNCLGNGIKIMKTIMKGRLAYDDIPVLKDMNLEKYRKESKEVWKILVA